MYIVCVATVAMQPTTELPPPVVPTSGTAAPILPSGEACLDHVTE